MRASAPVMIQRWVAAVFLCAALRVGAAALGPMENFLVNVWQVEDGLPDSSVTSIAQTADGYLWFGTFQGLVRFDGARFTIFDSTTPGLPSERVTRLFVDALGVLWIGMEYGELCRYDGSRFTPMTAKDGWSGHRVQTMANLPDGALLLGAGADKFGPRLLLSHRDGVFKELLRRPDLPHESDALVGEINVAVDREGNIWLVLDNVLGLVKDGKFERWKPAQGEGPDFVRRVAASSRGGVWIWQRDRIRRAEAKGWLAEETEFHWELGRAAMAILEDSRADLWLGSWTMGMKRRAREGQEELFSIDTGFPANTVRAIFEDREGNLWMGTDGNGLIRLRPRQFHPVGAERRPGVTFAAVGEDRAGGIWAGLANGGMTPVVAGKLGEMVMFPELKNWGITPTYSIWSLWGGSGGVMWGGHFANYLIQAKEKDARVLSQADGMSLDHVFAIYEDQQGTLWVGGEGGLLRYDGKAFREFSQADGLSSRIVRAITGGPDGSLWIGTTGGGLNRFRDGKFEVFTMREGLAHASVRTILADEDGTLWIGTEGGGLSRFRGGKFTTYSVGAGLPGNEIAGVVDDGLGYLWLNSNRGIFRAARLELEAFAEGRTSRIEGSTYLPADGLASIQCSPGHPTALRAKDGNLWFASMKGLTFIDPRELKLNEVAPTVAIEEAFVDGRKAYSNALKENSAETIEVPHGTQRVDIRFTGISLTSPSRVSFKYRMAGMETRWTEAEGNRVVTFGRLGPGKFQFEVMAANSDGVWSAHAATLGVLALPAWWQTWWFRAAALFLAGGTLASSVRWRLQRLRRAKEAREVFSQRLIESQEQERRRIAAELHDSLGQTLLIVKNRAALASQAKDLPPEAVSQLSQISSSALDAIDEVRSIVRDLRPPALDRLGLTRALNSMLTQVSGSGQVRLAWRIDNLEGALPLEKEINFYRVVQEALNNVLKHSRAASARVQAQRTDRAIILEIEDDGCGFDLQAQEAGNSSGLGLSGIRERVRILGGTISFRSRVREGTLLRTEIPIQPPGN